MDKFKARKKYQTLRDKISSDELLNLSVKIANNCLNLPIWNKDNYHIFLPIKNKNEVDTTTLINVLNGKEKQVIVSKSNFKTITFKNYVLSDDTLLKLNKYGIPEPINGNEFKSVKIEVVFIPLLAYDLKGNRVGYGKGFYDRFLKKLSKNTIKIGLSFFLPENYISDCSNHDIQMDYCVSPKKVFNFL